MVLMTPLERAAEELYAADPWGEVYEFTRDGVSCITEAHFIETYRDMTKECVLAFLDAVIERGEAQHGDLWIAGRDFRLLRDEVALSKR